MKLYVGVDIGGTTTKIGTSIKKFDAISFMTPHSCEELTKEIAAGIKKLCGDVKPDGVGVGCPGAVDGSGKVDYMPNLNIAGFSAIALKELLCTKVALVNDADAAALGECKAYGLTDAVMLTLGTGVGSGIVIGGKIYEGHAGKAAELGHMIVEVGGRKCGCGMNGCLEAYASAIALVKRAKEAVLQYPDSLMREQVQFGMDASIPFKAEAMGDEAAKAIIDEYIRYLGTGIINICNIFRPQAVIIGGGVSNQGDNLISRLREFCQKFDYGYKHAPQPQILCAKSGAKAGIYGAIEMIKYKVEENLL